jgi:hypothetical protein
MPRRLHGDEGSDQSLLGKYDEKDVREKGEGLIESRGYGATVRRLQSVLRWARNVCGWMKDAWMSSVHESYSAWERGTLQWNSSKVGEG